MKVSPNTSSALIDPSRAAHMIFVSYSRKDRDTPVFQALKGDLECLKRPYWLDEEKLHAGARWWDVILRNIRSCDIFVPVLTTASLGSTACQRELAYALELDRIILPISLEEIPDYKIPRQISPTHVLDYSSRCRDSDALRTCLVALTNAIEDAESAELRPLPDPLPDPPDVPPSYLDPLRQYVEASVLSPEQQRRLIEEARRLRTDDETDQRKLEQALQELRDREEIISSKTQAELDALLTELHETGKPTQGKIPENLIHRDFDGRHLDCWKLVEQLKRWYESQDMDVDVSRGPNDEWIVHCHGRTRARAVGAAAELTSVLALEAGRLTVSVGGGRWVDKATSAGVAAVASVMSSGVLLPTFGPSVVGSYRQLKLPKKTFKYIEEVLPICRRT